MTLQEQLAFAQEMERKFLNLDTKFGIFPDYDNCYRIWADAMGEIQESIWRLQELEK